MRKVRPVDRRRFWRREMKVKSSIPASISHSDGRTEPLSLAIIDISEGGVRLKLERDLPAGEFNLVVDISHYGNGLVGELILPCEVVWKRHFSGSTWVYGVEFVTTRETCEVLTRVLKELTASQEELESAPA